MSESYTNTGILSIFGPEGPNALLSGASASSYASAWKLFSDLVTLPHLECILLDQERNETFHTLVTDALSRLTTSRLVDISVARTICDSSNFFALRTRMPRPLCYCYPFGRFWYLQPMIIDPLWRAIADFLTNVAKQLDIHIPTISSVFSKLSVIQSQFEQKLPAIESELVGQTLYTILKDLYRLDENLDDSAIQIAILLNIDLGTISSDFAHLFSDTYSSKKFAKALQMLLHWVRNLQSSAHALVESLSNVTAVSETLIDFLDNICKGLEGFQDSTQVLDSKDVCLFAEAWKSVSENMTEVIRSIEGMGDYRDPQPDAFLNSALSRAVPRGVEIRFEKLIAHLDAIAPQVKAESQYQQNTTLIALPPDAEKLKILLRILGTPSVTADIFNEICVFYKRILNSFDTLLEYPLLRELACRHPDDSSQITTIFNMVTVYRQKFRALAATILLAGRDMQAYTIYNINLLPVVDANKGWLYSGHMLPDEFIAMNLPLVEQYVLRANDVRVKFTWLKDSWTAAVGAIQASINEANRDLNTVPFVINEQPKQEKFFTVIQKSGALEPFAATAFIPDSGILADLFITGSLGGLSVGEIIQENKIGTAMDVGRLGMAKGREVQVKLQNQLSTMVAVDAHLMAIAGCWSDILSNINPVDEIFYQILDGYQGQSGYNTWTYRVNDINNRWKSVYGATKNFISNFQGF